MQLMNNTEIEITTFLLAETGTYREMPIRPWETSVTRNTIDVLSERVEQGGDVGVSTIADLAGSVLFPTAAVEGVAGIANGWTCRRFRFIMRVVEKVPFTDEVVQRIFLGYTDNSDASKNNLEPDMRIYFNSETELRTISRPMPNQGIKRETLVTRSNQIISPMDMGTQSQFSPHNDQVTHLIRPDDIFDRAQRKEMTNTLQEMRHITQPISDVISGYGVVGKGNAYKLSRRWDNSPSRYLTSALSGYYHGVQEAVNNDRADSRDYILSQARLDAENQSFASLDFFEILRREAGFVERGYVTYGELCAIFPRLDDITEFSMNDGRSIRRTYNADDSESWMGADNVMVATSMLAQTVPAIMMDNYIRSIMFTVTNGDYPGEYRIIINPDHPPIMIADGLDVQRYVTEFARRLKVDVLNTITHNNQVGFHIYMSADIVGDAVINIAIGDKPMREYIAPTFSDSLYTPMITHEQERGDKISNDLTWLMEEAIPIQTSIPDVYTGRTQELQARRSYTTPTHNPAPTNPQGDVNDYTGLL